MSVPQNSQSSGAPDRMYLRNRSTLPASRPTAASGSKPIWTDWNQMMTELFHGNASAGPDSSSGIASDDHYYTTSESSTHVSPYNQHPRDHRENTTQYYHNPREYDRLSQPEHFHNPPRTAIQNTNIEAHHKTAASILRDSACRFYKNSSPSTNRISTVHTHSHNTTPDVHDLKNCQEFGNVRKVVITQSPMLNVGAVGKRNVDQNRSPSDKNFRQGMSYQRSSPASTISGGEKNTYKFYPESVPNHSGFHNQSSIDPRTILQDGPSKGLTTDRKRESAAWLPTDSDTGHSTDSDRLPKYSEHKPSVYRDTMANSINTGGDNGNNLQRFALTNVRHSSNARTGDDKPMMTSRDLKKFLAETVDSVHKARRREMRVLRRCLYFEALPDDLVQRIFASGLKSDDLCRAATVCKRWYRIVWCPALWTTISLSSPTVDVDQALSSLTTILSQHTPTVCLSVERVDVSGCHRLTDRGLYLIACRCVELRVLDISGCHLVTNIAIFEVVSRCVSLEHLNVKGCTYVTCISLTPEANIQATTYGKQIDLSYLDMTECLNLVDSGLQLIASYCSKLVYLYLRRCSRVSDIGVQYVATYCPALRELSISDCHLVTDIGVRELVRLSGTLRYLSVAKCTAVSDGSVRYLAQQCTRLRYINLRGCELVSDTSIMCLADACGLRLRSIDVGKCHVTDRALVRLAERCPDLRKLGLRGCTSVSDCGVTEVARRCFHLQQINIQDCRLSVESFRAIRHYCRDCLIEHTNPAFY